MWPARVHRLFDAARASLPPALFFLAPVGLHDSEPPRAVGTGHHDSRTRGTGELPTMRARGVVVGRAIPAGRLHGGGRRLRAAREAARLMRRRRAYFSPLRLVEAVRAGV